MITMEMMTSVDRPATDATFLIVCQAGTQFMNPSAHSAPIETTGEYIVTTEHHLLVG